MKSIGILPSKDRKSKFSLTSSTCIRISAFVSLLMFIFIGSAMAESKPRFVTFHAHVVPKSLGHVEAPKKGVLTLIHVELGTPVKKGQFLGWFHSSGEDIKITAPSDGVVGALPAPKNIELEEGTVLFVISNPEDFQVVSRVAAETDFIKAGQKVYDAASGEFFGTIQKAEFDRGNIDFFITPIRADRLQLGFVHFLRL